MNSSPGTGKRADTLLLTVYVYIFTCIHGWQIFSFFAVYGSMQEGLIRTQIQNWYVWQPYFLISAIIVHLLFYLIFRRNGKSIQTDIALMQRQIQAQSGMLLIAAINTVLYLAELYFNLFDMAASILSLISVYYLSAMFFRGKFASWRFPTTIGSGFTTAALAGWSLVLICNLTAEVSAFLLVFLGFDMLIIYSRFRSLSQFSPGTREVARKMLGRYALHFGIRVILGIFMPVVFIIYGFFTAKFAADGVGSMILIGIFFDKYLLINLTD